MTILFTEPSFVPVSGNSVVYPGAKLYFYATGTSTPQNTYTDSALSVAHANPVVADADGRFAPIYLDPALLDYKIVLKDSSDVTIWTVDPYSATSIATTLASNVSNISALLAVDGATTTKVFANGYHSAGDGGGGEFYWDASQDKANHNGGTIIDPDITFPGTWSTGLETAIGAWFTAGTGTGCWVRLDSNVLTPRMFGAKLDGTTDDSYSFKALGGAITSNDRVNLGNGTALISASGTPSDDYGHKIIDLSTQDNVTITGDRFTFKVVNHDISTNGGLQIISAVACNGLTVRGLEFDMTATGVHTSSTQYPFFAAIIGYETATGSKTQDQLNGDWIIEDCEFKMYHPYGQYAQSGSAYGGDPNNGYKSFPIFVHGDDTATSYTNQNRNITIRNCTLKEGHNAYGFWAWAWNNVVVDNCTAESFVGKQSNSSGVLSGDGVPFIRYHQFYCEGLTVTNNWFRAKPSNERTTTGFEGYSGFLAYNTNLAGTYHHGECVVKGNTIIAGRGDSASSKIDSYITLFAYGSITIADNTFNGTTTTTNASSGNSFIFWNSEAKGAASLGSATLTITGNTFGINADYVDNIVIANGDSAANTRRLKQLVIANNTSLGQSQYFLKMSSVATAHGVRDLRVVDNLINGEFNTNFAATDTNSRAIEYASNCVGVTDTFVDGDVTTGTDRITLTAHSFLDHDLCTLTTSGTLPTGLATGTRYYIKKIDANTVELYSDIALTSIVDITAAAGGGTHTITVDGDRAEISRNVIRGKYYGIETNFTTANLVCEWNDFIGVNTEFVGSIPRISYVGTGAPSLAAADGSRYIKTDATTSDGLYQRENGSWVVIG